MPSNTPNLGLYKKNPATDGNDTFDINTMLNNNWDAIDTKVTAMPTQAMSRQALINGNFDVWQRGTSFTNPNGYICDRWRIGGNNPDLGTFPTITVARQDQISGNIDGSSSFNRISPSGAGTSLGANSEYTMDQDIEFGTRFLCGAGKKITISFWARSSIAGKRIGANMYQYYGSGGTPSAIETINGMNWTLSNNWTKYTFTFTTNTLVGKTFGTNNDDYLILRFGLVWGLNKASQIGTSTAETFIGAGNIDIAQVQVNAGDVALPFQPRSFADELALCQRYYERLDSVEGRLNLPAYTYSATEARAFWNFKTKKRITPTLVQGGTFRLLPGGTAVSIATSEVSNNQMTLTSTITGGTLGSAYALQSQDAGGWVAADAEF